MKPDDYTFILKLIYIYIGVSMSEWFLHKYIMHGDPEHLSRVPLIGEHLSDIANGHHYHHKQVLMNMKFKKEGTTDFYAWKEVVAFAVIAYFIVGPIYNGPVCNRALLAIIIALSYSFLSNNLHNDMHASDGRIPWEDGPSNSLSSCFTNNPIYKRLWYNHAIHHLQKGGDKFNFNIITIGIDDLFGTKKIDKPSCYDNTKYCSETNDSRCQSDVVRCLKSNDVWN